MHFEIIKFKDGEFEINIKVSAETKTAWFTLNELVVIFNKDKSVISRHIKNIIKNNELNPGATVAKNAIVQMESGKKVIRKVNHYNLDILVLLGYKIGSRRGLLIKQFVDVYFSKTSLIINDSNDIIIYDNGSAKVSLNISYEEQTVWATQKEIADVFLTTVSNINQHIKNILNDEELDENSVIKPRLNTGPDGKQYNVTVYNLDMVLAVGFRVSTKKATRFRKWAAGVLSEYMIKGYSIHQERCFECQNAIIGLQSRVLELENNQNKAISFIPGDELKSFAAIERYLRTAKKEIIIVDNYFGHSFDSILSELKVEKTIITNPKNTKINSNDNYKVIKVNDFHDRFIVVDDSCYDLGQSLVELGTKFACSFRIKDKVLINSIKSFKDK